MNQMTAGFTECPAFSQYTVAAPLRYLQRLYAEMFERLSDVGADYARWPAPPNVQLRLPTHTHHSYRTFANAIASHEIPMQLIVADQFPTSVAPLTYSFDHILPNDAGFGAYWFPSPLFSSTRLLIR